MGDVIDNLNRLLEMGCTVSLRRHEAHESPHREYSNGEIAPVHAGAFYLVRADSPGEQVVTINEGYWDDVAQESVPRQVEHRVAAGVHSATADNLADAVAKVLEQEHALVRP